MKRIHEFLESAGHHASQVVFELETLESDLRTIAKDRAESVEASRTPAPQTRYGSGAYTIRDPNQPSESEADSLNAIKGRLNRVLVNLDKAEGLIVQRRAEISKLLE
jgi:hypothetical protein